MNLTLGELAFAVIAVTLVLALLFGWGL